MQFHKLIKNSHPFFTSSKTKLGVKDIKKQIIDNLKTMSNLINKTAKQISASKKEVTFNLQKYINEIIVIKYGGSAMLDKKLSLNFFKISKH